MSDPGGITPIEICAANDICTAVLCGGVTMVAEPLGAVTDVPPNIADIVFKTQLIHYI